MNMDLIFVKLGEQRDEINLEAEFANKISSYFEFGFSPFSLSRLIHSPVLTE